MIAKIEKLFYKYFDYEIIGTYLEWENGKFVTKHIRRYKLRKRYSMSKITPMMTALHYGHPTEERITAIDKMIAEHYQNDIKNTICEAFGWYRKHSVPMDNIDKMIAEIEKKSFYIDVDVDVECVKLNDALQIINKYCSYT